MKCSKLLDYGRELLLNSNLEESGALLLLEFVLDKNPSEIYIAMNSEIDKALEEKYIKLLNHHINDNVPVQYIIGKSCFYGYDFIVNKDVLIPRYETEELVENVLYRYDEYFKGQKIDVADIATGSGCIAISLAKEEENMKLVATDISKEALVVARKNALNLGADVTFLEGDMVEPLGDMKFDIIVSNPPYIPLKEDVMPLVKDNEPNIALFGGDDGLKFYRIILKNIKKNLKEKAIIAFEHGYDKKDAMIALVKEYFPNSRVEVLKDLEEKDRMTFIYIGV